MYMPFPYDANDGREDLTLAIGRVQCGRVWIGGISLDRNGSIIPDTDNYVYLLYRSGNGAGSTNEHLGFRCALTP